MVPPNLPKPLSDVLIKGLGKHICNTFEELKKRLKTSRFQPIQIPQGSNNKKLDAV
jgi:hypothetical protein